MSINESFEVDPDARKKHEQWKEMWDAATFPCSEPDGNTILTDDLEKPMFAHDLMLQEDGKCPWCGKVENKK